MKPATAHENTSGGGDDGSALEGMASLTPIRSLGEGLSRDYLLHHKLCPIGEQADGSIVVAMAPGAIRDGLTDIAFAYRSTVHTQPVRIDGVLTPAPDAHALEIADQDTLKRCLLFLVSSYEYRWPIDNFAIVRNADPVVNALTFGAVGRRREKRYQDVMSTLAGFGDFSLWPFASREELESASKANASTGIVMP